MYLDLLLLTFIIVIVTDLTDFPNSVYKLISEILTKGKLRVDRGNIRLLTCSLCQTIWAGIIYLFMTSNFTIPHLFYVVLLAFYTEVFKNTILLFKDLINKIIYLIYEKAIKK